ncbi:MAG: MarR family transcriptional regulator [Rhodobiaceae bacterium]|nr:MarR family transcriptional regulator [Rhodobiaceae bacterium]
MKTWYEDSLGYKLARAARAHRTQVAAAMREIGIHPGQEALLQALSTEDGRTMGALADLIGVRPPTMSKMVLRMAAEGLVDRQNDHGDARRARVHLTDEGRERARALKKRWRRIEKKLASSLTDKDAKRLGSLLGQINVSLNGDKAPPLADDEADGADQ